MIKIDKMIKIILMCIVIFMVFFFLMGQINIEPEEMVRCSQPDPENCSSYYSCLGHKVDCSVENRFDQDTGRCQDYYLANCGDVYNPPLERDPEILCGRWAETGLGPRNFSTEYCGNYLQCNIQNDRVVLTQERCPFYTAENPVTTLWFNVHSRDCRPAPIECGSRLPQHVHW